MYCYFTYYHKNNLLDVVGLALRQISTVRVQKKWIQAVIVHCVVFNNEKHYFRIVSYSWSDMRNVKQFNSET